MSRWHKPPLGPGIDWTHPLARGLRACWLLNEGAGKLVNDLAGRHDGTLTNMGADAWIVGNQGPALFFDGAGAADDYVQTDLTPKGYSGLTMAAWVRLDNVNSYPLVFSYGKNADAVPELRFFSTTGRAEWIHRDNNRGVRDPLNVAGTGWHLFVATANGSDVMKLYRDGVDVGVLVTDMIHGLDAASNVPLRIGRRSDDLGGFFVFDGAIGFAAVWDRVLGAEEVAALYRQPYGFISRFDAAAAAARSLFTTLDASAFGALALRGEVNADLAELIHFKLEFYDEDAAAWVDISDDLLRGIKLGWGIREDGPLANVASAGSIEFRLNNSERNSAGTVGYYSPLHMDHREGWGLRVAIRLSIVLNGVPYPQHVGVLRRCKPAAGLYGPRVVECVSLDWMDQAVRWELQQLATLTGATTGEAFQAVIDAMPADSQPELVEPGTHTDTYEFTFDQGGRVTTAMAAFQGLADSSLCIIAQRRDGTVFCEPRGDRFGAVPVFTLDPPQEIDVEHVEEQVLNAIRPSYTPRVTETPGTVLGTLQGLPKALLPGVPYTFTIRYVDASQKAASVGGVSVISPVATTDYSMSENEGGGGADMTADLSITEELGGRDARFVVTNTHATDTGYLQVFRVRGTPLLAFEPVQLEALEESTLLGGVNPLSWEMPWTSDGNVAQAIADLIRDQQASPHGLAGPVRFYVPESMREAVLQADISTAISVVEREALGLSEAFHIQGGEIDFVDRENWWVSYHLRRADTGLWWRVGVVGFSEVGETTIVAPG